MNKTYQFLLLCLVFSAAWIQACNGQSEQADREDSSLFEKVSPSSVLPSDCDEIVADYDKLVRKYLKHAEETMETGEEDKQIKAELEKEAKAFSENVQKLGIAGLGGQECWQKFAALQMEWSQAALKLQQKALEKAQEALKNQQR